MRRVLVAAVLCATTLGAARATRAADAGIDIKAIVAEEARRVRSLAAIGPRTVTVGALEDRIAALPPFQRSTFGADADAIRRAFLLQVLVPEELFALGAVAQRLDQEMPTAFDVERARSNATLRAIRKHIGPETAISAADVQAYYTANIDRYDTPERYQIWRILCKTQDEAQTVLDTAKKEPAATAQKEFGDLAREHSIDKATNQRAGNLGFLTLDGTSNEPGLKVEPAIVRAAQTVRDGQLVPTPVHEGDGFAVVWRRATIAASKHSVDDVAAQIRDTIWKDRVKTEHDKLVTSLRADYLRDYSDGPLGDLSLRGSGDAGPLTVRKDVDAR